MPEPIDPNAQTQTQTTQTQDPAAGGQDQGAAPQGPTLEQRFAELTGKIDKLTTQNQQLAAINQQLVMQTRPGAPFSPSQQQQAQYQQPPAQQQDPRLAAQTQFIQQAVKPQLDAIAQAQAQSNQYITTLAAREEIGMLFAANPQLPPELRASAEQAYVAAKAQGLALNNGQPITAADITAIELGKWTLQQRANQSISTQQQATQAAAAQQRVVSATPATQTTTVQTGQRPGQKTFDQMTRQERREAMQDHKF